MKNIVKIRTLFCFLVGFTQIAQASDFMSKAWQAATVSNTVTAGIGLLSLSTLYQSTRLKSCLKDKGFHISRVTPIVGSVASLGCLYASAYAKPSVKNLPWLAWAGIVSIAARALHTVRVMRLERELPDLVTNNDIEIVKRLINHGYSSKSLNDRLLMQAIASGSEDLIDYLLETDVNLDYRYSNEKTLLIRAVIHNNEHMVEKLIKKGVKLDAQDDMGWTALMYATGEKKRHKIAKKLIDAGADVNKIGNKNANALQQVIVFCHQETDLAIALKNAGAQVDNLINSNNGKSLLSQAVLCNDAARVRLLCNHLGADITKTTIQRNGQTYTLQDYAKDYLKIRQSGLDNYAGCMPKYEITNGERQDNAAIIEILNAAERQRQAGLK